MPIEFARHRFHPVMHLPAKYEVFDFTGGYDPTRSPTWGIGKYNEKRKAMYTTELFKGVRNNHIGIDLAGPVGTEVFAFFDGVLLFQGYNPAAGDYGYTIVTEHLLDDTPLFALYGHLSRASIELRKPGDSFRAGDVIGFLGDKHENGGWNPHVHFQLSFERPATHDMPGVVSDVDLPHALTIYPDPRLVLGNLY